MHTAISTQQERQAGRQQQQPTPPWPLRSRGHGGAHAGELARRVRSAVTAPHDVIHLLLECTLCSHFALSIACQEDIIRSPLRLWPQRLSRWGQRYASV